MMQQTQDRNVRDGNAAGESNGGAMLYLHALSPVHAGTGQAADVIDLPIARERVTNWPYIPGSTVKGVLRGVSKGAAVRTDRANNTTEQQDLVTTAYGKEDAGSAGGVWFADARLLCMPVRSMAGTFAWVTCPMVLRRWLRDYQGIGQNLEFDIPEIGERVIALPAESALLSGDKVMFEEIDLTTPANATVIQPTVQKLADKIARACFQSDPAWVPVFTARFGIVDDETFTFLTETATEVNARISLNPATKTVKDGGLWYQETLPPESILTCPVVTSLQGARSVPNAATLGEAMDKLLQVVQSGLNEPIQIGGDASIGHGMVQANLDREGAGS